MLKNWKKKLIVMMLIFTLTFSNFAIVSKTYAASILGGIFSDEDVGDTGSANVEFDACFFDAENNEVSEVSSDINNEELMMSVSINVLNTGYLKDAKIMIGNGEELNFDIVSGIIVDNENIQTFENNELSLIQLNAGSEVKISFPIKYHNEKYVDIDNISKVNKIRFEGIYVNEEAEEVNVSKDVDLKLSWKDERDITVDSEVTKYIGYTTDGVPGLILQTLVKVDNTTDEKSLPVKTSTVNIDVPIINDVKVDTINVVAKSTIGTNGKQNDEVIFNEENWSYDEESNILKITLNNESQLVSTQNEDEVLKEENVPEEELYYSASGMDEYYVTYTYSNVEMNEYKLNSNISAEYKMYGNTKLSLDKEFNYEVSEQVGDIVTYNLETLTNQVSKGYTYLNYNNEENKYEIEIDNKLIFNVSYKDIVSGLYYEDLGNEYISKTGDVFGQNDIYYKSLKLSKENFDKILGEEGFVNIYDGTGNIIFAINKDTSTTEDENYEIKFDSSVKTIKIETSKPVSDGNMIFSVVRAYSQVSYEKEDYRNFDKLAINTVGKAKYIYLNELADCGNVKTEVKLEDTTTKANLEIGQDNLSTLAMNDNVELKIELNNQNISSDVYGESEFKIKMPDYVETVEVTDASIVYGEGLELSNVEAYQENENIYLKVTTKGEQNALSSGIVSNGTNIVLNANIKVDLYAPAKDENFELTYTNSEATVYETSKDGVGYDDETITYSAPSGVVSVNSTTDYNAKGSTLTSVKQGEMKDEIAIYSESREATMELTVMNNEQNPISNVRILGRIPFEGVKDIITNEDLGTTLTVKMLSGIVSDSGNNTDFTIYYSENGEATDNVSEISNGWTTNVGNFENVKSYLIVPNDSNYQMDVATKLRFTYTYEIPANLEHNEEIYGTFATYYTNNTEIATVDEVAVADMIGLVTGEGPEFDVTTTVGTAEINEFEELEIVTKLKNKGKITAENIIVEVPIPEYTTYSNVITDNEEVQVSHDEERILYNLATLDVGEEVTLKSYVTVDQIFATEGEIISLEVYSMITADDLDVTLKTEPQTVNVKLAEMQITIDSNIVEAVVTKGSKVRFDLRVKNLKSEAVKNAIVTMEVDELFNVEKAYVAEFDEDGVRTVEGAEGEFNASTRTITWKIDNIDSLDVKTICLEVSVNLPKGEITKQDVENIASVKADGTETYESRNMTVTVGKPVLVITQSTGTTNTYVKEGETINYTFNVKNEGAVTAQSVVLTDKVPAGLVVRSISYESNGIVVNEALSEKDEVMIGTSIPAGDTLEVHVAAIATSLNGTQELSVTNSGTVEATNFDSVESNEITHIVEATEKVVSGKGETSSGLASSSTDETMSSISKTYKITGTAWLDKNNDGMRNDDEELMKGVTATLVDSDGGIIKQSTATNSKGEYTFTGVKNGNYIIIFDYNTVLYTVTTYQKEGVTSNVNSDVITTKIEQDGVQRNGAVTDVITIADGSISNIDIGLINALKFDLSLNMGITKTTVQNTSGTKTTEYNMETLTKTEISAKQMAGSEVYIEYTFTVKNEGEIAGYAKKIVDYIPEDMNFNSGMNADWYTGTDGNLYTTALSNIEIQPGETRTFKLVLSRTMTNDNTGVVSNTAEICEDYNIYGVSDIDSTPANKAQNEDDFSRADSYLSVRTGEVFIYISVVITTIILIGAAIFIIVLKLKYRLAKGGV